MRHADTYPDPLHITLAPAGGYNFFQVKLEWTEGVISYLPTANPADEALWVPCTIPARLSSAEIPSLAEPSVFFTCIPFPQLTTDDTTTGAVLTFEMQCKSTPDAPDPGQSILRLVPFVIGRAGTAFADINNEPRVPALTDATVTCVAPTPTPAPTSTPTPTLTPVPPALIGGIGSFSELPEAAGTPLEEEGSSGVNASGVAGIAVAVTAGAFALGGAAWYARRRLR